MALWIQTTYSVLIVISTLFFLKGFLLKRIEVHDHSKCYDFTMGHQSVGARPSGCWSSKTFDRAIILVIDALRFDFLLASNESNYYLNKMPIVNELLNTGKYSHVYKFMADPPTTTMQRLKGLTTGSLPTFVDASSNFASSAINEDNFIDQLVKENRKISFMGDDTWLSLFPEHFNKSLPYPSLNVKDLHTVDNGIIKNIIPEILTTDNDVIIAHFLGVDHCGHTFGPNHPKMAEKLTQMDSIIRSVVKQMDNNTVLVVFGDHGMTRTGDHGGDSVDELSAGLFVFSNRAATGPIETVHKRRVVSQIDLVPSISLLLGLPIPFSNLGMIIPELFIDGATEFARIKSITQALRVNALQVLRYLDTYTNISTEFSEAKLSELKSLFTIAETNFAGNSEGSVRTAYKNYVGFLQDSKDMCQDLWAKFDLTAMLLAIGLLAVYCFTGGLILYYCKTEKASTIWCIFAFNFAIFLAAVFSDFLQLNMLLAISVFVTTLVIFFVIFCTCHFSFEQLALILTQKKRLLPILIIICFISYICSTFSNSFVVYEDVVTAFLFQSIIVVNFLIVNVKLRNSTDHKLNFKQNIAAKSAKQKSVRRDIGRALSSPRAVAFYLSIALIFMVRLTVYIRACREEQWTCEIPHLLRPLGAITSDENTYKNIRYFTTVLASLSLPGLVYTCLRYLGNLNGETPVVITVRYLLPFCYVVLAAYWGAQASSNTTELALTIPPRIIYVTILCSLVALLWNPLAVYVVQRKQRKNVLQGSLGSNIGVPEVFKHLKKNWRQHLGGNMKAEEDDAPPPLVYGLATVYSAAILTAVAGVATLSALVLGNGAALSIPLFMGAMLVFLEIHASVVNLNLDEVGDKRLFVPWTSMIAWLLLVSHFFFASGHQTTVPSIRFEAAFVGFAGDHTSYVLPTVLIVLNTFCNHVIGVLGLPLLLFWPVSRGVPIRLFEKQVSKEEERKGEFIFHEKPGLLSSCLNHLCMSYLILCAVKLLFTMAAAGLHRRHLMVWKIFAPHLVYEAAGFALTCLMLVLTRLYVKRIDAKLAQWIEKL